MADKTQLLLEAERRGILPAEMQPLLDEARRRGLVPAADPPPIRFGPPVRLPGGGVSIDMMTPEQFERQQQTLGIPEVSFFQGADRAINRRMLDALLRAPEVLSEMLAVGLMPRRESGQRSDIMPFLDEHQPLRLPSAAEVVAAGDVAGQVPGAIARSEPLGLNERFNTALERQQEIDIRSQEEAPVGTAVGEVAGDVATILATRGLGRVMSGGSALPRASSTTPFVRPAQTQLGSAIQTGLRVTGQGLKRAAETGSEAAILAALNEADPTEAGAIAAGVQAGGDLVAKPILKKLGKVGIVNAMLGAWLVSVIAQEVTPGGYQIVEETLKDRAKEFGYATILGGAIAGITGRTSQQFAGPAFAEITNVVRRSILTSNLADMEEDSRIAPIMAKFSEDPDFFGPKARRLIERAWNVEDASLLATVESLMDDRRFREKFESITSANQ